MTQGRIGIYGGTFDPVHLAHLVLAEQCLEQLRLDAVWFIPAAISPFKLQGPVTPGKVRREMLEMAIAGHPRFRVDPIELERTGPSYTVETLRSLSDRYPDHEWTLLLGADSLRDFPTWREPQEIVRLARVAAVNRGSEPAESGRQFRQQFGDRLDRVTMPGLQVSGSDLRARVREGRSIRFLVPRAVEMLIKQHRLYLGEPEPQ